MSDRNDKGTVKITSVDEFNAWVSRRKEEAGGKALLYRGVANKAYPIDASGYRRIADANERAFQDSIKELINDAKMQGHGLRDGREISDLELLAELQHYGAATCLIDFTHNPLIALWFACQIKKDEEGKDGAVIMLTDDAERFGEVKHSDLTKKGISDFLGKEKWWKWTPPGTQNNRIPAQNSVFLFSKGVIEENLYKKVEVSNSDKEDILTELKSVYGINEHRLFNDFAGFAGTNAHDKPYVGGTAESYFSRGADSQQRGEIEKATYYYTKAIELSPEHARAYNNLGNIKFRAGDYAGAISDYTKAIEINSKYVEAYYNRGSAKMRMGDYAGAIKDYDKVIKLNPKYAKAYYYRGLAKSEMGDHERAKADFAKAKKFGFSPKD